MMQWVPLKIQVSMAGKARAKNCAAAYGYMQEVIFCEQRSMTTKIGFSEATQWR
jgi:hypothetical protein